LTLSRAVLNLNQREHCLGLSYVAVSPVKALNGVLFERPFNFERFTGVNTVISQEQELDYTFRNTQLMYSGCHGIAIKITINLRMTKQPGPDQIKEA